MSRILMIGAGGVATVAAFKMAQNTDVFTELMIASHHKAKCDRLVEAIHAKGYKMNIKTAEVDADDVETVVEEEDTEDSIVEADVEDGDVDKQQEQEEEAATEAPASSDKADS